MNFQSLSFLAFFILTLAVCLLVGWKSARAGRDLLTLASLVFYLWGFWAQNHVFLGFGVLLLGSGISWVAARRMASGKGGKKGVLIAAVIWHTAVLLAFKYTGFLTGGAFRLPFVPLGLSFFTFQQIWFLKEAYTGEFSNAQLKQLNGGVFALFSFFFPTVSSGPIMKPDSFFPQLEREKFLHPDAQDVAAGLYAVAIGTGKKVLLADSFGVVVNNGWAHLGELSAPSAWLTILGYTLQLYFDFSGYCDIAAGLARMLGIHLPVNFDSPYRSLSIGEFWKRWHITLTSFLRECIYFPLGGSRKGAVRTYVNIMVIFLVSGFWHGAGWTFILWGALHGLGQVVERLWGKHRDALPKLLRWCITFAFVNVAWVFFRAPGVSGAVQLLKVAVLGGIAKPEKWLLSGLLTSEVSAVKTLLPFLTPWCNILLLLSLYGIGLLAVLLPGNTIRRMDTFRPKIWRAILLAIIFVWSTLSFTGITSFIYSNF
ncbi:MAG: MBOAT family protein [Oscillibacter sp.]|jgi:D-alanyl-lipoteichoic acid acyltransferase DltB (MBOAT superfamily)|nr:MBOAT family protein [Oscillibacter sp.]